MKKKISVFFSSITSTRFECTTDRIFHSVHPLSREKGIVFMVNRDISKVREREDVVHTLPVRSSVEDMITDFDQVTIDVCR